MSDSDNETAVVPSELDSLKARATLMGLTFHPAIGVEKLREKVAAALDDTPEPIVKVVKAVEETVNQKRVRQKQEALALVRIRVTCMNPAKKEWDGEILTVGNATVGSVSKYIPFNADEGWHVPNIIYQVMKDRMCQTFYAAKDARGNNIRKGKLIKEFAIEVLDPLTEAEIKDLAQRQAIAKTV